MSTDINYWAVLVSAIASIVIGSIWYGPLFGKKFMDAMGIHEWSEEKRDAMKKTMIRSYILQFVCSLVMTFVLAWYVVTSMHTGVYGGIANAFGLWIGFVVPLSLGDTLWGGKTSLFWINIGNMFVTLMVSGAILGGWR